MTDINRREYIRKVLRTGVAVAISGPRIAGALEARDPEAQETEAPDPKAKPEHLVFDQVKAEHPLTFRSRGPKKGPEAFADRMLKIATDYAIAHVSRWESGGRQVDQFLNLFGLNLRYDNGDYVPFCAAGSSFAACPAYADLDPSVAYNLNNSGEWPNQRIDRYQPLLFQT
jgi:hypothetical protein